eukprot:848157-Amphidinium_carterae.1
MVRPNQASQRSLKGKKLQRKRKLSLEYSVLVQPQKCAPKSIALCARFQEPRKVGGVCQICSLAVLLRFEVRVCLDAGPLCGHECSFAPGPQTK